MSPFNESVSVIDTPFVENNDPQYFDFEYDDQVMQHSIHRRMFFILAVVSMIVVGFSLFAIPSNTGASAPVETSISSTEQTQFEQIAEVEQVVDLEQTNAITEPVSQSISPIFTSEVRYWENQIVGWAEEHNLDPNIVATIMQIESCGNPQAVSSAGARGLFQVMPFHFSGDENMLDPDTNARRGLNFYNEQLRYTGNDKLLSFAGYNGGYAASGGAYANWPDETKRYHTWAKGIYEDASSGVASSETLKAWLAAGGGAGCQIAAASLNIN